MEGVELEFSGEWKLGIIAGIKRKSRDKLGDIRDQGDKVWEGKDCSCKFSCDPPGPRSGQLSLTRQFCSHLDPNKNTEVYIN